VTAPKKASTATASRAKAASTKPTTKAGFQPTRNIEPLTTVHPIPAPLLARLLHENFEDQSTQIQKGAMTLTGRYMEIFVREALARAKYERARSARNDGISDGFLQVEDLERLAPQLVLDF
jgi:hypothetical protein